MQPKHPRRGPKPLTDEVDSWARDAYDEVGFPCDLCWTKSNYPGTPARVKQREFCAACRAQRRSLLRLRQKNNARNKVPIPNVTISGKDVTAVTRALREIEPEVNLLDVMKPGDYDSASAALEAIRSDISELVGILRKHFRHVLVLEDLERRGFIPPFTTKS